ncbi:RagB/SusD family nutrient uptake outer membrane protein [Pontibacter flavimaris]|uniref:RagB/SusD family nutrient uptake outer membrane protein n=1 Tax=Pontibacter flavimaris TaxID=1797110 RepID=A0A1Q5PI22_9BACT|nr:RagB/SusD family nutrient uptake outer membrane protein [Pontibacter flavimaris]OKL41861.1 hypothetical protein A3841_07530 [Pontibacter flavimaris]
MKTKIHTILAMGLLGVFSACTDLDEEPVGLLAPESFFKTHGDAEAAVLSGYGLMAREEYYGRRLTMSLQLLSDMGTIGDQGTAASRRQLDRFIFEAGNDNIEHIWNSSYAIIGAANAAIEGIKRVEMPEANRNALDAEARAIRALAYSHLVQLFGDVPKIDYFIDTPEEIEAVKTISKSPAAEIYQLIISDLESTYDALPDGYAGDVRSRATKGSALTLLASLHLTLGNWEKAAEYSQMVINNKGNFGYKLMADFNDLWDATNGDMAEHVWTVDFLGQVGTSNFNVDYISAITGVRGASMQGWSVVVASPGAYDSFKDEDLRKAATFITEAAHGKNTKPWTDFQDPYVHTAKWALKPGDAQSTGARSDHNLVLFRYAEVLLIAAEALNEANGGPTAEAYEYINEVRRRAGYTEDLAGLSQEEFRAAVREERRVELAFEWKRWYDLKRWDMVPEAFTGPDSFEPQANAQEFHKLLPIPQAELSRNKNLLPQNPGYN